MPLQDANPTPSFGGFGLRRIYSLARQYANYFQTVMKLRSKTRNGARVHKVYDEARTPYQRLLEYDVLDEDQRRTMQRRYEFLNPVRLRSQIDQSVEALLGTAQTLSSR